jgi:hypothetical protein
LNMKNRFLFWTIIVILAGGTAMTIRFLSTQRAGQRAFGEPLSDQDLARAFRKMHGSDATEAAPLKPLELKRSVRLAFGSLGLADDEQNGRLGDLVLTELSGAQGLELVERQSLEKVLHELNMSLSGFIRAKDAVRAGKLLKADWFLLGTGAKINGTNSIVIRVVDARTGILRDARAFQSGKPLAQLAIEIAAFVRQSRQNAASAKMPVFLAIGTFQDVSINNRQAGFPSQLRGYLTAAYQGGKVTLLEREYVDTLLQEVRLDLAGLTEDAAANTPAPIQSAYWLVTGSYQSFETTKREVELKLEVTRIFGKTERFELRGLPGEELNKEAKDDIDRVISRTSILVPTRTSEIDAQMETGKDLEVSPYSNAGRVFTANASSFLSHPFDNPENWDDQQYMERLRRNRLEAIRAFQTVLLLDPTNREARLHLAACYQTSVIGKVDDARDLDREIIDEDLHDRWNSMARGALEFSFAHTGLQYVEPEIAVRWFEAAAEHAPHTNTAAYYRAQANRARTEMAIQQGKVGPAEELAVKKLIEGVRAFNDDLKKTGHLNDPSSHDFISAFTKMGLYDFENFFGSRRDLAAQKLVELLPRLTTEAPELGPYFLVPAVFFQVKTNKSIVEQFSHSFDDCADHPEKLIDADAYWSLIETDVCQWGFWYRRYDLVVHVLEGERRAMEKQNQKFDDVSKATLAYAFVCLNRWQDALDLFARLPPSPLHPRISGPWGTPQAFIEPDKMADVCRAKLGPLAKRDARECDLGSIYLEMQSDFMFATAEEGLLVATEGRLHGLDFNFKTNYIVPIPGGAGFQTYTCMCAGPGNIWLGSDGGGLFEFDKTKRAFRRRTEADGLAKNWIASLCLVGDSLWIGYGGASGGALGRLTLRDGKITSFMNSFTPSQNDSPPKAAFTQLDPAPGGDLLAVADQSLWRYHVQADSWEQLQARHDFDSFVESLAADAKHLVEGMGIVQVEIEIETKPDSSASSDQLLKTTRIVSTQEASRLRTESKTNGLRQTIQEGVIGALNPSGAIIVRTFPHAEAGWQTIAEPGVLTSPPTTLALDGKDTWAGGKGYIAVADLDNMTIRRFYRIPFGQVWRIQPAAGYMWVQVNRRLYRLAL